MITQRCYTLTNTSFTFLIYFAWTTPENTKSPITTPKKYDDHRYRPNNGSIPPRMHLTEVTKSNWAVTTSIQRLYKTLPVESLTWSGLQHSVKILCWEKSLLIARAQNHVVRWSEELEPICKEWVFCKLLWKLIFAPAKCLTFTQ